MPYLRLLFLASVPAMQRSWVLLVLVNSLASPHSMSSDTQTKTTFLYLFLKRLDCVHRIRMETEARANSRHCFLGENGRPLRLCSRRMDKGRPVLQQHFLYYNSSVTKLFNFVWQLSGRNLDTHSEGSWFESVINI